MLLPQTWKRPLLETSNGSMFMCIGPGDATLSSEEIYPVRIVAFNAIEGWSRDATADVADAVAQRAVDTDAEVTSALEAFIPENSTKAFNLQLSLPLRGAA